MTLHKALVLILQENNNEPMTVRQLADAVTERACTASGTAARSRPKGARDERPGRLPRITQGGAACGPAGLPAARPAPHRCREPGRHRNAGSGPGPPPPSPLPPARRVGAGDHVVIASSHLALKTAGCWWPGARYLVRSGPDGADLALLDLVGHERIAERFAQVTIASGDGIFALAAASLVLAGCQVSVVSRRAGLSRQLALAVGWKVIYIDARTPGAPAPAAPGTAELAGQRSREEAAEPLRCLTCP